MAANVIVNRKKDESFDSLMKRFRRAVEKSGISADMKRIKHYQKPSEKQHRKEAEQRRAHNKY